MVSTDSMMVPLSTNAEAMPPEYCYSGIDAAVKMVGCYFHIADEAQTADTYHYTVKKQQGVPFEVGDFLKNIKRQSFASC